MLVEKSVVSQLQTKEQKTDIGKKGSKKRWNK